MDKRPSLKTWGGTSRTPVVEEEGALWNARLKAAANLSVHLLGAKRWIYNSGPGPGLETLFLLELR